MEADTPSPELQLIQLLQAVMGYVRRRAFDLKHRRCDGEAVNTTKGMVEKRRQLNAASDKDRWDVMRVEWVLGHGCGNVKDRRGLILYSGRINTSGSRSRMHERQRNKKAPILYAPGMIEGGAHCVQLVASSPILHHAEANALYGGYHFYPNKNKTYY